MQVPSLLINSLSDVKGFNKVSFEEVHSSGVQITSIRLNPAKINDHSKPVFLDVAVEEKVPWNLNGYYLSLRPSFTLDPMFHAGAYYVQEASSMFLEEALRQVVDLSQPLRVLDLCAAPGGKSTLIQSVISDKSLLVSNEVIKSRVSVLTENITKWGAPNVIVTNNDPKDFQRLPGYFDVMVVDAPCSGSGLFRKDPGAISEWSEQNVELCSHRQQRILADVLPTLKENGILIYSTCSFSTAENEDICNWLVKEYQLTSIQFQLNNEWNIIETTSSGTNAFGYRFYPDKLRGEGFFIAAFRMGHSDIAVRQEGKPGVKFERLTSKEIEVVIPWLKNWNDFFYINQHEDVIAIPVHMENDFTGIRSALYIKKAGVKLGTIIRNELIPDHELAQSSIISQSFPAIEVNKETALQYLRRHEVKLDTGFKGWALLTHNQLPLGWIKLLPNRVNNYYPKEWRILNK